MTDSNYTAIAAIVDRSGSMASIQQDAQEGLNAFIESQKTEPGRCTLRIDQFDSTYENLIKSTDINDVPKYTLSPRGMTALTDALGKTITDFGTELAGLPEDERPGQVIVVVVTDGGENSSREYTRDAVKALIEKQENEFNWKFIFLAANQDAITVGAGYGFGAATSMTFDANNIGQTYAMASNLVSQTRSGIVRGFTDEERAAAVK